MQHLTDTEFLAHLEQVYPQPTPWTLLHVPERETSKLISALLCKQPPNPLPAKHAKPTPPHSPNGSSSAPASGSPLPSLRSLIAATSSCTSSYSPSDTAPTTLSEVVQSLTRSGRWARGSPTWVDQIHASKRLEPQQRSRTRCLPQAPQRRR